MELFTAEFLSALVAIVLIDLVLAGDNAIVIALAARNLPHQLQKKAIIWGTLGAIFVRSAITVFVVWLLQIPGLMLVGGLLLIWIAWKLIAPAHDPHHQVKPAASFWAAMKTIVIADAVMGLDNVLAVAGAAHGSFFLVVFGLLISIPIVIGGSRLILKWIERYPAIIYVGAIVIAWTAVKLVTSEAMVEEYFERNTVVTVAFYLLVVGGVVGFGYLHNRRHAHVVGNV